MNIEELEVGDFLRVHTFNSIYTFKKLGDNEFEVTGGWFDKKGMSPCIVGINGYTWGGSMLKMNCLELDRYMEMRHPDHPRIRTSYIAKIEYWRPDE